MRSLCWFPAIQFCTVLCFGTMRSASAQPIEKVIVETYQVGPSTGGGAPLITYRIFLDLAPDHSLQMVYGDEHHSLRIETSTSFHNTVDGSVIYADQLVVDPKRPAPLTSDSWLTIGKVGADHVGIPLDLDTDGSLLGDLDPLIKADGLLPCDRSREVMDFEFEPGYLAGMKGSTIETTNGAWALLGGMKGPTKENIVLIAQLTTTGRLHFVLNAQIGTPDGNFVKVVAKAPLEGEVLFDQLTYGQRPVTYGE